MLFSTRARVVLGFASLSLTLAGLAQAGAVAHAPVLTGLPPASSVVVGQTYTFAPKATDADGSRLTFSITNKPSWIAFDTATGAMTGTPTVKGVTSGIVVSVTDGTFTKSLPAFTLTVKEGTAPAPAANKAPAPAPVAAAKPITGNAALSWTTPTENEDGSALGDLAGFRVVYGTSPDKMTQQLDVPGPSLTSVSVEELAAGTYYFAVKAYSKTGAESALSEIVYKQIM
jgi:hypothetical protein